jgi:methylated-DNA-[protein]-cysteine S-methyltransferase
MVSAPDRVHLNIQKGEPVEDTDQSPFPRPPVRPPALSTAFTSKAISLQLKMYYQSPIGTIRIESSEKGISGLVFIDKAEGEELRADFRDSPFTTQIDGYFNGKRKIFDLPLDLKGTEFQKKVWNELLKIPFGKTISYKELSIRMGNLKAIRAVAAANGANPVSIIVPCHRVIGSDGSLTGYAGGLWRKRWLLDFENNYLLF